ncbi:rhodanese-like domain-containing protein [Neobacillus niacini]|uniref:rhodanese-like domain-containing protein n=1 Tax=Neobacillus niacini TaxID=86668 RepID=UPI002FFED029
MKKIFTLFAVLLLAGCMGAAFENVTVEKAKEMIDEEKVIILDVRTPEEYNSGHIPGSELVPLQVLEGMSEDLDKDKSYLLVCRSGNRSQQAAEILTSKGFKNVYNMTGGMNEWTFEIEQ